MQRFRLLSVLSLICSLIVLIAVTNATCSCNEPGIDQCGACKEQSHVRPKPKLFDIQHILPPNGENYWCNKLHTEPDAFPKPCDKIRESMEFMCALNSLVKRKLVEIAIAAKDFSLTRLRKRLNRLEQYDHNYQTAY